MRYSVTRSKKIPKTCPGCGEQTLNPKYCSNECQHIGEWLNIIKPRVEAGGGTPNTISRYLKERDGYQCVSCGISSWNGKELVLQIDHIDGVSDNNAPSNLRFLCPNCHTQTDTFAARNRKNTKRNAYLREYKKIRRYGKLG